MRYLGLFTTLFLCSLSAHADVYRCQGTDGRTFYQSTPCQDKSKGQQLDIHRDPEKEAVAKAKLQEIQTEYDTRKLEQQKNSEQHSREQSTEQNQKVMELN